MATFSSILSNIVFYSLIFSLIISILLAVADSAIRRKVKHKHLISFIMPTYNDANYIQRSITSIYSSLPKKDFELIVINDKSLDKTKNILQTLRKKYNFKLINNKVNLGKASSVNLAFRKTKGDLVIIIDSDTVLNKKAITDLIARFDSDRNMGGVSCRYKLINNENFITRMQAIEYNMLSLFQGAYNPFSALAMWGGLMGFRREAFEEIGGLSKNFLTEDLDAANKLNEKGWKVHQSFSPVYTQAPSTIKSLFKQKIRWSGGYMQCLIKHYKTQLKNPIAIIFALSYGIFALSFVFNLIKDYVMINYLWEISKLSLASSSLIQTIIGTTYLFFKPALSKLLIFLGYTSLSVPYILIDREERTKISKYLLLMPFSLIYLPIFSVVSIFGFIYGIYCYIVLKREKRAW
jgi:cellulose synthase/poly-beta-1,6-N-acetylglucosamine synthase-like glycosyltransferase